MWRGSDGCAWSGPGCRSTNVAGNGEGERCGFLNGGNVRGEGALFVCDRTLPVRLARRDDHLGKSGTMLSDKHTITFLPHELVGGTASQIPTYQKSCLSSTKFFPGTPHVLWKPY